MRTAKIERKTKETEIVINLNIDGEGGGKIKSPIGFLTHVLESFAKHGQFDIDADIKGDLGVDQHHTVEDTGIVLGKAFKDALKDMKGINRAGYFVFPMDESLSVIAVDIGGRSFLKFDVQFKSEKIGDLQSDLIKEFFKGFADSLGASIHIRLLYGENDHHKAESLFKAFAKAMMIACYKVGKGLPTTKGRIG
jgi:imidazoleglycerol-phosphate dehydratase